MTKTVGKYKNVYISNSTKAGRCEELKQRKKILQLARECVEMSEKVRPEVTWLSEVYDRYRKRNGIRKKADADILISQRMHGVSAPLKISELLQRIEQQLVRLNQQESYGMWEAAAYFFSNEVSTAVLAAATYKAIMAGENSGIEQAHVNVWISSQLQEKILGIFTTMSVIWYTQERKLSWPMNIKDNMLPLPHWLAAQNLDFSWAFRENP